MVRLLIVAIALTIYFMTSRAPVHAQIESNSWTGTWQTYWRGGGAILRLEQSGTGVTGTYPLYDGSVEGTAEGQELRGRWSRIGGRGEFMFVLSPDGNSFMGRFDTGEWWTGTRLANEADYKVETAVLTSPRDTLRSFLTAGNAAREGFVESIRPALQTIDFSHFDLRSKRVADSPLLPGERIDYARQLFHVLDELTLRIWSLPGTSDEELAEATDFAVTLQQAGTANTFELRFHKRGDAWLIQPPSEVDLDAALRRLCERRGGRIPTKQEHLLLSNPRDTVRTFIEEMHRFDSGGRVDVLRTLDLQNFAGLLHDEDADLLARYLKQIIDRISFVIYQEIPNNPDRRDAYIHFRHRSGDIVIAPFATSEGSTEWRFTADTLQGLRSLYAAIENMPEATGIIESREEPAFFAIRELVRSKRPGLLRPVGPLEGWQWLSLLFFLVTSVVVAVVLTSLILWLLRQQPSRTSAFATRRASAALVWPLRFTFIGIFWYLEFGVLGLPEAVSGPLRSFPATLAIGSGVWLAYRGLSIGAAYSRRLIGTAGHEAVLTSLVFGVLRVLVIVAGVFLMAEIWSVPYTSVLAGLGIGGLAVALAAQPTLQNMIAGFTLFADNPLSVGDFCRYGDNLGTVEEIGLRSTRIRSLDRTVVAIPNSAFADMQLENFTKRDRILLRATMNLRYETTADQLRYVLTEFRRLLIAHPKIHPDPARVRFIGFGTHSLDIEVFAYVCTSDYNEYLAIREDVYLRMMGLVLKSGTGFAFPSQVNYLASDGGVDATLKKEAEAAVAAWREQSRLPFPDFAPAEVRQLDGRLDYPPNGSPTSLKDRSEDDGT